MTFWDRHLCITASLVHSQRWSSYRGLTEITFYCNGEVSMDELVSLASLFFVDHIYSGSQSLRGWYWKLGGHGGGWGGGGGNPNLHSKWFTWLPGFSVLVFQWGPPSGFGEQGNKGIYFRGTEEQRLNFEGNRGTKIILGNREHRKSNFRYLGNKGTGTPPGGPLQYLWTGKLMHICDAFWDFGACGGTTSSAESVI